MVSLGLPTCEKPKPKPGASKAEWRQWAKEIRQHNLENLPAISHAIGKRLLQGLSPNITHCLAYWPKSAEIDIAPVLQQLSETGVAIYLPKVTSKAAMGFAPWQLGEPLIANSFKVLEPTTVIDNAWQTAAPSHVVCIVPMLAARLDGIRLGYGGGYYDTFLAQHPNLFTIGVVMDSGLIPVRQAWQPEPWDQPCHRLVTETLVMDRV